MNKDIEKAKTKLKDLQHERERKEVRYATHLLIVEGARETLIQCEERSRNFIDELTEANNNVGKQQNVLNDLIEKFQKEQEQKTEENE
jgi:hypothetical protein